VSRDCAQDDGMQQGVSSPAVFTLAAASILTMRNKTSALSLAL
jgi:hypothetical protein